MIAVDGTRYVHVQVVEYDVEFIVDVIMVIGDWQEVQMRRRCS